MDNVIAEHNHNTTEEDIIKKCGNDKLRPADIPNKGSTISNTDAVRWNSGEFNLESQIKQYSPHRADNSICTINQSQPEKISSVSTIHDNMTTTDTTTGSCVSSASNIDVSSASARDGNYHE